MTGWVYPRAIVHRCGGALAPENTLAGLRVAARLGCRAVEFDVMLSADGVPVLIHDETLERTTDGSGAVAEQSLAVLGRLDAGCRHGRAFRGERIPTLQEALFLCRDYSLAANVEIKPAIGHEEETGKVVGKLVADWPGGEASLLLSSFSEVALVAAAATAPKLARALLVETIPADWADRVRCHGAVGLHCAADALAMSEVAAVVASGVAVACYTVNDPARAATLFAAGVAAVFTDRPELFPAEKK